MKCPLDETFIRWSVPYIERPLEFLNWTQDSLSTSPCHHEFRVRCEIRWVDAEFNKFTTSPSSTCELTSSSKNSFLATLTILKWWRATSKHPFFLKTHASTNEDTVSSDDDAHSWNVDAKTWNQSKLIQMTTNSFILMTILKIFKLTCLP